MTTTLQDAIAAARAGEMERAQLITADVIRDNPDDPNAWYLLSQLVDSDARRAVYLAKTLELDPNHPRARQEYDELPPALHERIGVQPEPVFVPPTAEITPAVPVEAPVYVPPAEVEAIEVEAAEVAPEPASVGAPAEVEVVEVEAVEFEAVEFTPEPVSAGAPAEVEVVEVEAVEFEAVEAAPEPVVVESVSVSAPAEVEVAEGEAVEFEAAEVAPEPVGVGAPVVMSGLETSDWIQPLGPTAVPMTTVADLPAEAAEYQPPPPVRPVAAAVPVRTPARRNTASQALTFLLGILLFLALLVVGMLAYLIFV
jgi:hypothetical protein